MNKKIDVSALADYAALKKLAAALWGQNNAYHGAAIMVGAGFSRGAATTGEIGKKLPLWGDLSAALAKDLAVDVYTDPLRLAEEYKAHFGEQALSDLIKMEVKDEIFNPGEIHRTLLEFPWADVLTTNWDTLLERAALKIHQPVYDVVCKQSDLVSANAPRIVKLHGTINLSTKLVFTQEDYRKYPIKYAAFVNLTRQVFIENELCLLGFSGDDPNFLRWTGWVRDNLMTSARRIYLVGALNLSVSKRKYLESINVAPIDLHDLVSDYDDLDVMHAKSTEIFLDVLADLKPMKAWEWRPTKIDRPDGNARDEKFSLESMIPILKLDRESYPGWLVCPPSILWEVRSQIKSFNVTEKNLSLLNDKNRGALLYELFWRLGITFEAIPKWLSIEFMSLLNSDGAGSLLKKQKMEIALLLLRATRWFESSGGETLAIRSELLRILEENFQFWPESKEEVLYVKALIARDDSDYSNLEKITDDISPKSPDFKLKKSSLLAELGKFEEGEKILTEAYQELLQQSRANKGSIYISSRLEWARYLLGGALMDGSHQYRSQAKKASLCDPRDYIEYIQNQVVEKNRNQKKNEIEPLFEPGHYRDHSNTVTYSSELHPYLLFDGVASNVGIPLRWRYLDVIAGSASKLVDLSDLNYLERFSMAVRAASSDSSGALSTAFSRIYIACLEETEVGVLINRSLTLLKYWIEKKTVGAQNGNMFVLGRIQVTMEIVARLLVRAPADKAREIFLLAVGFTKNIELRHHLLHKPMGHLIAYALKSIPRREHKTLLLEALKVPLSCEVNISDHGGDWPNPVIETFVARTEDTRLDRRLDEIIEQITHNGDELNGSALRRLIPLVKNKFLTAIELEKIAIRIWGSSPDYLIVPKSGLLNCVLLELPSPNVESARLLIRNTLFRVDGEALFDRSLLMDILRAGEVMNEYPDEQEAIDYFLRLTNWRPEKAADVLGFSLHENSMVKMSIAKVLSSSVIPYLPAKMLNKSNFEKLTLFYSELDSPDIIEGFIYFAQNDKELVTRVASIIRRGLRGGDSRTIAQSSFALLKWRKEASECIEITVLISKLIYLIESERAKGLTSLIWTANRLLCEGWLSNENIEVLSDCIPYVFEGADYRSVNPAGEEAISVSILRASCVRLAQELTDRQPDKEGLLSLLQVARKDSLPEVRFAVEN